MQKEDMKHMAPRPLAKSWSSPSPTIAHYNGTVRWHPAMAPRPLPQSWSSPSPSNHSTLQGRPAMATMAHYNGTLQWHHVRSPLCSNGTLVPRPICQNGSSPSPLLEVRTPIAIAIWEKKVAFWNPDAKNRKLYKHSPQIAKTNFVLSST